MKILTTPQKVKLALIGAQVAREALRFLDCSNEIMMGVNMTGLAQAIKNLDEAVTEIKEGE